MRVLAWCRISPRQGSGIVWQLNKVSLLLSSLWAGYFIAVMALRVTIRKQLAGFGKLRTRESPMLSSNLK